MWLGQFTLPLACLLWWSVLAWERGRPSRALAWWAAGVLWKPAGLLWLPLWLRERALRPGLALALTLVAANGLYFLARPADLAVFAAANLRLTALWVSSNVGLAALLYQFTGPGALYETLRALSVAALAAPALWVTWRRGPGPGPEFWRLGAVWTTLSFLVYKEVWEQHLVLLVPFLVLGLLRRPGRLLLGLAVWLALPSPLVFYDVPGLPVGMDPQPHFPFGVSLLHHAWRAVPVAVLYGLWLRGETRPRRHEGPAGRRLGRGRRTGGGPGLEPVAPLGAGAGATGPSGGAGAAVERGRLRPGGRRHAVERLGAPLGARGPGGRLRPRADGRFHVRPARGAPRPRAAGRGLAERRTPGGFLVFDPSSGEAREWSHGELFAAGHGHLLTARP